VSWLGRRFARVEPQCLKVNVIVTSSRTILEIKVISILVHLLLALHHCHHSYRGEWTLLHRNIKPENGTRSELPQNTAQATDKLRPSTSAVRHRRNLKLADFDLAKILDNGIQQAVSFVGVS
jgi:serine/threonine protein kinase